MGQSGDELRLARTTSSGVHERTLEIVPAFRAISGPGGAVIRVRGSSVATREGAGMSGSVKGVVESAMVMYGREKWGGVNKTCSPTPYRREKTNIARLGWC